MTISTTKPKLIVPRHVWDKKTPTKSKKEIEKIPQPTGFRIVLFPLKLENKTSAAPTCNIRKEEVFVCRGEASAVPFVAPAIWIDAPLCAPWMP